MLAYEEGKGKKDSKAAFVLAGYMQISEKFTLLIDFKKKRLSSSYTGFSWRPGSAFVFIWLYSLDENTYVV